MLSAKQTDMLCDIPNVVAEALQFLDHRGPACWPYLGERYIKGDLEIEFNFRLRSRFDPIAGEFRAIFKSAITHRPAVPFQLRETIPPETELGADEDATSRQQMAMLVYVLHFVQEGQGVRLRRVPSVVRLERLHASLGGEGSALDVPVRAAVVMGGVGVDRELDVVGFGGARSVSMDDLPPQMVNRDALIVQTIPNDVEPFGGMLMLDTDAHDFVTGIRVVLSDQREWHALEEGTNGRLEAIKVRIRPSENVSVRTHRAG